MPRQLREASTKVTQLTEYGAKVRGLQATAEV